MLKGVTAHPTWTTDKTCAWWKPWAAAIQLAGFDFVRFDLNWQDPDALPKCQAICTMLGPVKPYVSLGSGGSNWQAPDAEDYANVAGDVARLLPAGGVLEVWNEPNVTPNFWPSPASAEDYALVVLHAYDVVKAQAAHVVVMAPNLAFNDRGYLDRFLTQAPKAFDVLSIHPYTAGLTAAPDDPDDAHKGRSSLRAAIDTVRDLQGARGAQHAPVAVTEIGWPAADAGPSHYRSAICLARDAGVVAFGAFNLGDHPSERNAYSLLNPDYSPTLAARVIIEA